MLDRSVKRLSKKARRGMRGYPIGTVAFYGPDDKRATKVSAGVRFAENTEPEMRSRCVDARDARNDAAIAAEILALFEANGVLTVAMIYRIIGCPHQEGIDYEGEYCPVCTFWNGRDRFTGKKVRLG